MAFIKLNKTTEDGQPAGILYANTDLIAGITEWRGVTVLEMADGRDRWVKEKPGDVAELIHKNE